MQLRNANPKAGPARWRRLPLVLLLAAAVTACEEEQVEALFAEAHHTMLALLQRRD